MSHCPMNCNQHCQMHASQHPHHCCGSMGSLPMGHAPYNCHGGGHDLCSHGGKTCQQAPMQQQPATQQAPGPGGDKYAPNVVYLSNYAAPAPPQPAPQQIPLKLETVRTVESNSGEKEVPSVLALLILLVLVAGGGTLVAYDLLSNMPQQ